MEARQVLGKLTRYWMKVNSSCDFRPYWRSYYPNTNAIIYVVDSSDKERIDTSKQELMLMLEVNYLYTTKRLIYEIE